MTALKTVKTPGTDQTLHWWQRGFVAACLATLLATGGLLAVYGYYQEDYRAQRSLEEQSVLQKLSVVRAQLESYLNGDLYLVKGLIALPMVSQTIDEQLFSRVAAELANKDEHIKSLQLAPDGIVTYVWPYDANKGAIGHNLLGDPERRKAAQRAIDGRELWVAGPVKLIQGGTAVIGRYPIFVTEPNQSQERFWGFANVLIDWESIVERAHQAAGESAAVEIAMRGKDGMGAQGELIYGQPEVFANTPITLDVVLPGGIWHLAGVPNLGWTHKADYKLGQRLAYAALVLILAVAFYSLLRLPIRLRRMVQEATDNLRHSEYRLVDAIEAIPDAFAIFDAQDRLVLCNANFRRFYERSDAVIKPGTSARRLIEFGIERGQFAAQNDRSANIDMLESKLQLHRSGESHYEEFLSDGRVLRVVQRRMRDGGLAGIRVDITDLKRKELELIEARQRADTSNEAKSTFLATVSHELRTPLNVVIGILTALEPSNRLSVEERSRIGVAARSGKHLLSLVNEILDLTRIESGNLDLESTPFKFADLIKPALNYAEFSCEQKGLNFIYEASEALPDYCVGDSVRLRQVLFNLLSNAVKYTDKGSVRFAVNAQSEADGQWTFTFCIDDSGPGISEEMRPRLFEAFVQGDASLTREHGGAGLGLAISQRLAKLMGTEIMVGESSLGGARFSFTLSLACVMPESAAPETKTKTAEPNWAKQGGLRILVVDDSPTNQLVVECLLEGQGHVLKYADSGAQAVQITQEQRFDLILMDISMPDMNGVEATQLIRQALGDRCPAIVAVTAHSMAGDRSHYLEAGMDGFITKPIDKQELLSVVNKVKGQTAEAEV
jgi:signal transduction histidine kinase/ActR/RegA family two-component response regulator